MDIVTNGNRKYVKAPIIENKNKTSVHDKKSIDKNPYAVKNNGFDESIISKDAILQCRFLRQIENDAKNNNKASCIAKYTNEYEKIKNEIASGAYGSDKKRYMDLLNNAYKNALSNFSKTEEAHKGNNIKMSSSTLIKCQKQYEAATSIVWMLRAENKRILEDIEYYKKKKNRAMVNSLTRLSTAYKHAINNLNKTGDFIRSNINESFASNSEESKMQAIDIDEK